MLLSFPQMGTSVGLATLPCEAGEGLRLCGFGEYKYCLQKVVEGGYVYYSLQRRRGGGSLAKTDLGEV